MHLEAITFDIDDTLWDNVPVMIEMENDLQDWLEKKLGTPLSVGIDENRVRRMAFAQTLAGTERRGDVTYVRRKVLHDIILEMGIKEPEANQLTEEAVAHMLTLRHRVTPFPEVDAILQTLKQNYRLAVITNGNVDVNNLALGQHFDVCYKAGEIGMPKPDTRIFLHALKALGGIDPHHAMHVGDSWESDVEPAAELGMQVAWIDIFDEKRALPNNVHRLRHVRELPDLLKHLGQLYPE